MPVPIDVSLVVGSGPASQTLRVPFAAGPWSPIPDEVLHLLRRGNDGPQHGQAARDASQPSASAMTLALLLTVTDGNVFLGLEARSLAERKALKKELLDEGAFATFADMAHAQWGR